MNTAPRNGDTDEPDAAREPTEEGTGNRAQNQGGL